MKIIYVLKDAGRCGGHRVVLEHLKGLASRGYDCELCYLSTEPVWFGNINFKLNKFGSIDNLINYLAQNKDAIKVATWWETAYWVMTGGGGYYLVQDIEASRYQDENHKNNVLNTYKLGLHHIVENAFTYAVLKYVLGVEVTRVELAVNHNIFKYYGINKKPNTGLYFYRNDPIKNPGLMKETMSIMGGIDFKLYSYGLERCSFASESFINIPDIRLAEIMNRSEVFISTSIHEGFCLPLLESMACGTPVITTRAVGNEIFCINGVNCLIVENSIELKEAIIRILTNKDLAKRLSGNCIETADNYQWDKVIDRLEKLYVSNKN